MSRSEPLAGVGTVLVVGLGRSGVPAARALAGAGVRVVACDTGRPTVPDDLAGALTLHAPDDGVGLVDDVDLVVTSPGVPEHAPVLRAAARRQVPVWSEPELGFRLAPRRVVGVTGTNGKTTVTEMTTAMLRAGGVDAVACGNIGDPFTRAALASDARTLLVAELSSFQLHFAHELRPDVGVMLNLAADHLDWHGDMDAYGRAKARIWQAQGPDDWAVGNSDDAAVAALVRTHAPGRVAWSSRTTVPSTGVGIAQGTVVARLPGHEGRVVDVGDLHATGPHHLDNVCAAACAALLTGASAEAVADAAAAYRPGRHRLEEVAVARGVRWVNDSKATNPHAAAAALAAVDGPVVWIAGGLAKGVDLTTLAEAASVVRHAVVIGEAADDLAGIVVGLGAEATVAASIEEAVEIAAEVARPGETVLLAPACASFDQFRDYAERGDRFVAAVTSVVGGVVA